MKIKSNILIYVTVILLMFVLVSCVVSEVSWSIKDSDRDDLRQLVGLPSLAVGNLSPSARNPGVELFCTGLYDVPGGYCNYYSNGVPYVNFTMATNFTVSNSGTENAK